MRGLRLARQDELEEIFARYAAHAAWMREIGIHQWNNTDYLGCIRRTTMRICSGAGFFLCSMAKMVRSWAQLSFWRRTSAGTEASRSGRGMSTTL